jgi:hypothetical protein
MSTWFREQPLLMEDSIRVAIDFLDRSGEIDDFDETFQFLVDQVGFMIAQGQRNKLLLANRAISAFQRYRRVRTIELSLIS